VWLCFILSNPNLYAGYPNLTLFVLCPLQPLSCGFHSPCRTPTPGHPNPAPHVFQALAGQILGAMSKDKLDSFTGAALKLLPKEMQKALKAVRFTPFHATRV